MWTDLGAALALMLVLEGILPFLSPDSVRRLLAAMSEVDNRSMLGDSGAARYGWTEWL